jgi:Transposase family tnp2
MGISFVSHFVLSFNLINMDLLLGSNVLSDEDHDNIRAFKLRMVSNMPRMAFEQMRFTFKHKLNIHSLYVITHRMAILSGIEPQWFDCCVNSCIAYTGSYQDLDECPDCSETRRNIYNEPRRLFCYIPFIPRLQDYFANEKSLTELQYRHNYTPSNNSISDVFDSQHYRNLCKTRVTVDGRKLPHQYFEGKHDIAFSTCLDSYLLYKRRRGGPSACPILIQIYNLPPEIRTHISRLICIGVIPGPKAPKRPATFYYPFEKECALLALGVKTFDCVEQEYFRLHAYNIFPLGDIVAIEKVLNIKGHNGKSPCRSCEIKAINNPDSADKTYYVPLNHPGKIRAWKPAELPLRTHASWADVTAKISQANLKKDRDAIAMHYGIKGMPALQRVGSIDYARGVPWDYMHLLLENVVKNLVHLWMGKFKGLDAGIEDYVIPDPIWKEIGLETLAAVKDIPSAFVRSLGNIVEDQSNYTAEGWAFWFMHIAPILLQNRFQNVKYYQHFYNLVNIMKTSTQFTLTYAEIDDLEKRIIEWVEEFERYVL